MEQIWAPPQQDIVSACFHLGYMTGEEFEVSELKEPGDLKNLVVGIEVLQDLKANPLPGRVGCVLDYHVLQVTR